MDEALTSNFSPPLEATTFPRYDVFLSFRGDIRDKFASHLYERLTNVGFSVFKDDIKMVKGDGISEQLKMAINNSKICIPIFSKNYASSKACLRELSHMVLECNRKIIIPIFYNVLADDVELKTSLYMKALKDHQREGKVEEEEVEKWKKALLEVGKILGYNIINKSEANEITVITQQVLNRLMPKYQHVTDHLVGIDNEVEHVMNLLHLNSKGCCIIGLCGMGGIGKTTLASILFNRISSNFGNHCTFIANVREEVQNNELLKLQLQLYKDFIDQTFAGSIDNVNGGISMIEKGLEKKNFLLVLDDMDDADVLKYFVGDPTKLTNGTIIIITTRNKRVLDVLQPCPKIYEVRQLDNDRALQLFSRCALRRDYPPQKFKRLSMKVVDSLGGLPLALEVIGSSLFGRSEKAWEETIERLQETPDKKIESILMKSYHGLHVEEREIFLDIACYPGNLEKTQACYMWEDCGWHPNLSIDNLTNQSLVKFKVINEIECLWMHDILKDLGRSIIRKKRKRNGRKVRRFWQVDKNFHKIPNEERKYVEMLQINSSVVTITSEDLVGFKNVRFLRLSACKIEGNFEGLFPNLRWISINDVKHFMATNFNPKNLVALQLNSFHLEATNGDWWSQMKAHKLKVLVIFSSKMEQTPSFKQFSSLEVLILDQCSSLVQIDSSIKELQNLIHLSVRECRSLACLPQTIKSAKTLEEIVFKGHSHSSKFPSLVGNLENLSQLHLIGVKMEELEDSIGNLVSLRELDISGTCIKVLAKAIGQLKELRVLRMNNCSIIKFPTTIGRLMKLEELEAQGCKDFEGDIPSEICLLSCLRILNLRETPICRMTNLPSNLTHLFINSKTTQIEMNSHNPLELVNVVEFELCCQCGDNPLSVSHGQVDPRRLNFQWILRSPMLEELRLCIPYVITGLEIMNGLSQLKELNLSFAEFQDHLQLPSSLSLLTLNDCNFSNGILDVSHVKKLKELQIRGCDIREIQGLELDSLVIICLSKLRNLSALKLWNIKNLVQIDVLDELECSIDLSIRDCPSLEGLPTLLKVRSSLMELWNCKNLCMYEIAELESLTNLSIKNLEMDSLKLIGCGKLAGMEMIGLELLTDLLIWRCPSMEDLTCLSSLRSLLTLTLWDCENLKGITQLDGLESLTTISIEDCPTLEEFPCLSNLRSLSMLALCNCENLKGIVRLDGLESLTMLYMGKLGIDSLELTACGKLEILGFLTELNSLTSVSICKCPSLRSLPYLSKLENLKCLTLHKCEGIVCIEGFTQLKSLERVFITHCQSLELDPSDISKLNDTSSVWIEGCDKLPPFFKVVPSCQMDRSYYSRLLDHNEGSEALAEGTEPHPEVETGFASTSGNTTGHLL